MVEAVYVDELTPDELCSLLRAPYSEMRMTNSGRDVILYHKLNTGEFLWLAKELGYKWCTDTLEDVLDAIYWDDPIYTIRFKRKGDGGYRKLLVPDMPLRDVQRRILDNILLSHPVFEVAFGYSGGSVFDALGPHLEAYNRTLFSADIKDAFGSVWFETVFAKLYGLPITENYAKYPWMKKGDLSWEVAFALTRLVTCGESLPQGAPSSPRLFDMVFLRIDRKLEHLAENVGGVYTRYADNIYFSMPQAEFPDVVARAIIRTVHENRHEEGVNLMDGRCFRLHKICTRSLDREAIRALGVNLVGGEIHPTRQLKTRIRLSIHRLNWLLANTPYDLEAITKCWGILEGQMSFASHGVVPPSLEKSYKQAKENYEGLIFNGEVPTIT